MTCECMYLIKEGTIDAAKSFIQKGQQKAYDLGWEEWWPVCICRAKKDFYYTSDYDGMQKLCKVHKNDIMVFVQGKYKIMCMIKMKGIKRGFPRFSYNDFEKYIEDLEFIK